MDEKLHRLDINTLDSLNSIHKASALTALESGKVVYFPSYFFTPQLEEEKHLFAPALLDGKHKNLSFDYRTQRLGGSRQNSEILDELLMAFMGRYAEFARKLVITTFPQYQKELVWGRTSYRPAEIEGRTSSKRKDDTRLHVDSFAATPVNGLRILRVFCNINPHGKPRSWHLGEPFADVFNRFAATIPPYRPFYAKLLRMAKITKSLRSAYDHYQLHLHDTMKLSDNYQQAVNKYPMNFPAKSTWIVFTDHVSHAALSGQFLLEQTFYLPVAAMASPALSPWSYWDGKFGLGLMALS